MTVKVKKVLAEALSLPPKERAALAENILTSPNPASQQKIDELWAQEAEDRIEAYDRGEIKSTPVEEVFESIKLIS